MQEPKTGTEPRPKGRFGGRCGKSVSARSAATERIKMAAKALSFDVGDYVVYPKRGVGRVVELQSTEIAGTSLDLYVLRFEKEKMTLRVPVNKADSVSSASFIVLSDDSLRIPTESALLTGTRRVIFSFSKRRT